jgi:apolipoprotein D and lipocalin family protein
MKKIAILVFALIVPVMSYAKDRLPELKTVESVDIIKTMGTWYEIARFTHWFERGAVGVKSTSKVLKNGKVDILNSWFKTTLDGKQKTAHGKGKVVDNSNNAKIKISFFWPFYGEYWIIDSGKDYEYMVVGEPERESLWIFARTPAMDPEVYNGILERLEAQGYDLKNLERVPQ